MKRTPARYLYLSQFGVAFWTRSVHTAAGPFDDQLEVGRLLDRNVGWLDATKSFDDHRRRLTEEAGQASAIFYS
jgi:hypothetical protein